MVVAGLLAVVGSIGFARLGYSMILPGMKDGLRLTYTQMGLMASGNFIGYMIFAVLAGMLTSKYGPRIVITSSLLLAGVSMLLTGFARDFHQALILRSLTGIGSGGSNTPAIMMSAAWLSAGSRGLASGVITSGNGLGVIITGFLVPKLNEMFGADGWRYSWLALGVTTLLFTLFCGIAIKSAPAEKASTYKPAGIADWRSVGTSPLIWKMGLTYFTFGLSYVIYVTFFGAYLVKEAGLTVESAGTLWALVGGLSIASGPLWGHISDRIGRRYSLALVYFLQSFSFLLFTQRGGVFSLYTSVFLFGVTAWSIVSVLAAYCGDCFSPSLAFSALGFLTLFFGVGQALGPSIAGYIADLTGTFTSVFLLSSLIAALGGLLSIMMLRKT